MSVEGHANPALQALLDNRRRFLDFLERRLGSRADAEDVLQGAFLRAVERGGDLRRGESAVAWIYRLLRHAIVDRRRAEAARGRALEAHAHQASAGGDAEAELRQEACRCVLALLPTLRAEYGHLLRRVDLEGEAVPQVARDLGLTANNAGVRLHRARRALLREVERTCRTCATQGCLDCHCGGPGRISPAEV
jgi:RNA polymerase sigma factor (sigma-70 family)